MPSTIHIKVEDAPPSASPEIPQRYPSFTEKWSQSPLRVSIALAEDFYRSTIVKVESEEALVSKNEPSLLCHDCKWSVSLNGTKPTTEVLRDLGSPQTVDIKTEARPSPRYYIPPGASSAELTTPSASKIYHRIPPTINHSRSHHEARAKAHLQSISPPTISNIPGRCTVSPLPMHRLDTELSYLLPVTPTPFSTSNAPVNPYSHPSHLHCIPGSILEEMKRRTRWGNRDSKDGRERRSRQEKHYKHAKQYKQYKLAAPVPQSRYAHSAKNTNENKTEISNEEAANPEHGKTCAWYKIPFCRCCVCIMVVGTKLLRNVFVPSLVAVPRPCRTTSMIPTPKGWVRKEKKKKWWHFQKGNSSNTTCRG